MADLTAAGLMPNSKGRDTDAAAIPKQPATLQEFAERRGRSPLSWQPGSKFAYAMGLDILAAVVEKASGMPNEQFLRTRLLTPLGMNSTFWQVPASEAYRLASAVNLEKDGTLKVVDAGATSYYLKPPSFPFGGAGLVSNVRDYDRFAHAAKWRDAGWQAHPKSRGSQAGDVRSAAPKRSLFRLGPIPPREATGFGADGFVTLVETDGFGRKRGTFGWGGALGARAWVNPGERVRINMMINGGAGLSLKEEFEAAVAAALGHNVGPSASASVDPTRR